MQPSVNINNNLIVTSAPYADLGCGGQNAHIAHNCPKILFSEANMLTREILVFVCMNRAISRMRGVLVMVLWPFMGHFTPPTPCHGHNTSIIHP